MSISNVPHAFTILQTIETISSSLSFFSCAITLYDIYEQKKFEVLTNKLLMYLLSIDIVLSIFYGIGISGAQNHGFCQLQGLIVQWFGLADIFWVTFMSYQMYKWVVKKKLQT